jgi:hypothetical protein
MVYYEWQDPGTWDEGPPPLDNTISIPVEEYDRLRALNAEMLEALKEVANWIDEYLPWEHQSPLLSEKIAAAIDAAIAKATAEAAPEPDICPDCGSELGHRVNCPRGIAFSRVNK